MRRHGRPQLSPRTLAAAKTLDRCQICARNPLIPGWTVCEQCAVVIR